MLVRLRREYAQLVTSGAQLVLLFIGFKLESYNGWLACLAIMAAISMLAWQSALRRLRAIRDTPTSKVASAAQGYVELIGSGHPFTEPLISQLRHQPCLWYRYKVERRGSKNKWHVVDSGESEDSFILRDESGECLIDPDQAEIMTSHHNQWVDGNLRYTEWRLAQRDDIYVIGELHTQGGSNLEFNTRAEIIALLAEWKKNMPDLHAKFDLDNNGELDMKEWMLARSAAKREVAKKMREAQAQPDIHIISQPRNGNLFLVSNLPQEKLSRRYLLWSWAHLVIFFGALGGIGWLLQTSAYVLGLQS